MVLEFLIKLNVLPNIPVAVERPSEGPMMDRDLWSDVSF